MSKQEPPPRKRQNIKVTVDDDGPQFRFTSHPPGKDGDGHVVTTMTEARRVAETLCIPERNRWSAHVRFCHAAVRADVLPARDPTS